MSHGAASKLVVIDLISDNEALKFEVAGRMANVIAELKEKNGGYMPQDLNARGFTPTEVAENWNAAHFLITISHWTTWGRDDGQGKT